MNIQLIIFDFDGTLGDTRGIVATTMQQTLQELGIVTKLNYNSIRI